MYKMSEGLREEAATELPGVVACGDVAVVLRPLRAKEGRHSSDLTEIPEISSSCVCSPALPPPFPFLPSLANLQHVFV